MSTKETLRVIAERYDHMFSTPLLDWTAHDFLAGGLLFLVGVVLTWFFVHEVRIYRSAKKRRRK